MAKLILSMDGLVLKEIVLTKERTSVGRKPHNDIQIDNLAVSGEHAVIVTILNDSFLEDLGSTNGTLVNGQPIKKHFLQNNDVIELGKYKLKYLNDTNAAAGRALDFEKTMVLRPGGAPKPESPMAKGEGPKPEAPFARPEAPFARSDSPSKSDAPYALPPSAFAAAGVATSQPQIPLSLSQPLPISPAVDSGVVPPSPLGVSLPPITPSNPFAEAGGAAGLPQSPLGKPWGAPGSFAPPPAGPASQFHDTTESGGFADPASVPPSPLIPPGYQASSSDPASIAARAVTGGMGVMPSAGGQMPGLPLGLSQPLQLAVLGTSQPQNTLRMDSVRTPDSPQAFATTRANPVYPGETAAVPTPPPAQAQARVGLAAIQILTGSNAGRELELVKPLTTLGKPQVQVAVITKRPNGYYITHVEGATHPIVNGRTLDAQATLLADHDIIEIAGVKMEFYFK